MDSVNNVFGNSPTWSSPDFQEQLKKELARIYSKGGGVRKLTPDEIKKKKKLRRISNASRKINQKKTRTNRFCK